MKKSNNFTTFYKNVKKVLFLTLLLIGFVSFAQVGVGTTSPDALSDLHVVGDNGIKIESTAGAGYTLSPDNGTVGQVLVNDGSGDLSWGNPGGALNITTETASYSASATDDIIKYGGSGDASFTLPSSVPIGKMYYIANGSNFIITFTNTMYCTTGNQVPSGTGCIYIHLGSGEYSGLYGGF